MIDPVIFTIGGFSLRWYGVIVMLGVIVGSLMVERVLKNNGENSDTIWDALIWVLPIGILGARLWFVVNATLGGDTRYANDPSEILKVWHGGLHIFGGLLLGGATLLFYLNKNKLDTWLFLDAAGPAMLVGQAIGRIANFINQELYGPPTTLPWGILISAEHRLPQFANLPDTTRFHPTFAYEMLWNFLTAGILLWLSKRYEKQLKPGTIFAGWLLSAGIGRAWIEIFRPDQPKIAGLGVSYSMIASALMAICGAVLLMARYKAIRLQAAENWEEEYKISTKPVIIPAVEEAVEIVEEPKTPRAKKVPGAATKSSTIKKKTSKAVEKATAPKKKPAARTKKSSE
ncbi:MAG: prolipoprotein diacylglyceryl transferase [Chloroflexota bacterium]